MGFGVFWGRVAFGVWRLAFGVRQYLAGLVDEPGLGNRTYGTHGTNDSSEPGTANCEHETHAG
jgi:hypothetical protein